MKSRQIKLLILFLIGLAACGQKGPLEIEKQPTVQGADLESSIETSETTK